MFISGNIDIVARKNLLMAYVWRAAYYEIETCTIRKKNKTLSV